MKHSIILLTLLSIFSAAGAIASEVSLAIQETKKLIPAGTTHGIDAQNRECWINA